MLKLAGIGTITSGVVLATLLAAIMVGQHIAAYQAEDVGMDAETATLAELAKQQWRSQVDLGIIRVVTTRVEEFRPGYYLFYFDVYHWHGIARGYLATGRGEDAPRAGGTISSGYLWGLADKSAPAQLLTNLRSSWSSEYGTPRVLYAK